MPLPSHTALLPTTLLPTASALASAASSSVDHFKPQEFSGIINLLKSVKCRPMLTLPVHLPRVKFQKAAIRPVSHVGASIVSLARHVRAFHTSKPRWQKLSEAVSSETLSAPGTPTTRVTELANGFRIATEESPGHFNAVGVYIDAGTRFESEDTAGISHVLDRIAFKSTDQYESQELVEQLESIGGSVVAHSSRESIIYQASVFPKDVEKTVGLFSEIIRRPKLQEEDLKEVKESTLWELNELAQRPDTMLPEVLHQVAFQNPESANQVAKEFASSPNGAPERIGLPNSVGRPLLCPPEKLEEMSINSLHRYRSLWYTPNRMVLAGIGVDHDKLVHLAQQYFGDVAPASPEIIAEQKRLAAPALYTGGVAIINTLGYPPPANPEERPLTYVYIAFEGIPTTDPDIYPLATLNTMMGGGGSFSAGGPGKGMYSRLYTRVLNRYHWVENCQMFNFAYSDTGLFGISAAVPSERGAHGRVLPVLCEQLLAMTDRIGKEELQRAKNQLRSNLLMSLESKVVELEDLGRQVLAHSRRVGVRDMCDLIDRVTEEDVRRVAQKIIWGMDLPPSTIQVDGFTHPGLQDAKPWIRSGNGEPTLVIQGPLMEGDPLFDYEQVFKRYRIGRKNGGLPKGLGLRRLFGSQ